MSLHVPAVPCQPAGRQGGYVGPDPDLLPTGHRLNPCPPPTPLGPQTDADGEEHEVSHRWSGVFAGAFVRRPECPTLWSLVVNGERGLCVQSQCSEFSGEINPPTPPPPAKGR